MTQNSKPVDRTGIYAGSFDPITFGHIWVIEEGLLLFDKLIIAIGVNPSKKGYFSIDERKAMIQEYLNRNGYESRTEVISFEGKFLVDVAQEQEATAMLRGIRNAKDFEYELEIKNFNEKLDPNVQTVFVVPPPELVGTSSSIIRGTVGLAGWERALKDHTTDYVITQLKNRMAQAV